MSKKILIFIPSIEGGGVEKNLFLIVNYLSEFYDKTTIITCSTDQIKYFRNKISVICPKFFDFRNSSRLVKYIVSIFFLISYFFKERDTLIFSFQANLYCSLICKLFQRNIVIRSNSSSSGWSGGLIKSQIFKILFKLPNKIIVNSVDLKNEFINKFDIKPVCIFNPFDKKDIKLKSKIKSKKYFKKSNKFMKIINVGRFVEQKNQILLLKALNNLKDKIKFEALIMGSGKLKNFFQDYIIQKKLSKIIKIIDYQKNPFGTMKQADLFVLTSNFEGMPNVLLESIYLNLSIISSNCPTGPREIIDKKYLFQVNNLKDLQNKIQAFYKNEFLSHSKNFKKKHFKNLDKFNLDKNLLQYKKVIDGQFKKV